ncbi:MAG TPA: hypothetical protein PKE69_02405 [Pyrinomonadaceae bacterium]|nr:hypothetical protein [Pyrinomonadaceae bacterium]
MAEIVFNDLRTVQGINVKIPHIIEIGARDDTGRIVLRAVFTITNLKINQPASDSLLAPNFTGAEQFWDSDEKKLVSQ